MYLKKPEFNRDPLFQQFGSPVPLKRAVVTAEPSVVIRKLKPNDMFLIFASDGLWEHLSDEAAVEIVFKNPRVVRALQIVFVLFYSSLNIITYLCIFTVAIQILLICILNC